MTRKTQPLFMCICLLASVIENDYPSHGEDGDITLRVADAIVTDRRFGHYDGKKDILVINNTARSLTCWLFEIDRPGDYRIEVIQSSAVKGDTPYWIKVGGKKLDLNTKQTRGWDDFQPCEAGHSRLILQGLSLFNSDRLPGMRPAGNP